MKGSKSAKSIPDVTTGIVLKPRNSAYDLYKNAKSKGLHSTATIQPIEAVELEVDYGRIEESSQPNRPRRHFNQPTLSQLISIEPNVKQSRSFLGKHGWPIGMQDAFLKSCRKIPKRYFIIDDSGSMLTNDGHRLIRQNKSS